MKKTKEIFHKKNLLAMNREYCETVKIAMSVRPKKSGRSYMVNYNLDLIILFDGDSLEQVQALNDQLPQESRLVVRRMFFNCN